MDDQNKNYFIMNIFIESTRDVWVRGSTLPLLASKERQPLPSATNKLTVLSLHEFRELSNNRGRD